MNVAQQSLWQRWHIDLPLLAGLVLLMCVSGVVLYSVAGGDDYGLVLRQAIRLGVATLVMAAVAQIPPNTLQRLATPMFALGVLMLVGVLLFGHVGKGAQRWLDLGFMKFQPSEIMKLAMPLMMAHILSQRDLPPRLAWVAACLLLLLIPVLLIAKQPDLGTSILVASAGLFAIFLAGVSWQLIAVAAAALGGFIPILWFYLMHDYQRQRVLTFLNPESDPLGSGYHIIQSKIAIGSGGFSGKGWFAGTQSQLEFLPERHTDFIFAVFSEEFGLVGIVLLLCIYALVIGRGMWIAHRAQTIFGKLVAGSITLTFFVYLFVNMGMVSGILPVVGVPLPLVSYGGTSMVTLMAGFGILMSIHTNRRMLSH